MQQEARASLEYALQHCHALAHHNKALVLKYLVPVSTLAPPLPISTAKQVDGRRSVLAKASIETSFSRCWNRMPFQAVQVQLLLGHLPSPTLLAAHQLRQYEPIIAAMRSGDVKLFSDTMNALQFRFIQEVRQGKWWGQAACGAKFWLQT